MRIGVDIMGGDFMPHAPIDGVIRAYRKFSGAHELVLIGDKALIGPELQKHGLSASDFEIVHTESYIGMDESPTKALAQKKDSSINLGIGLLASKNIAGFVSAGNTGAMLVASIFGLGKIPGVIRPTIGILFPNDTGKFSLMCDVGANVDCKPDAIRQFGLLGSVYMETVQKVVAPRVALINLGEEESKGPQIIQTAHQMMKAEKKINFIGNVEGRGIYTGVADVLVCDGFIGNVVLKFGESLYDVLKRRYGDDEFIERFNFENYGGVPILGIRGISIVGHGISNGKAIENMIMKAVSAAETQLTEKIEVAFQSPSPAI